jgi:hypothetical protein
MSLLFRQARSGEDWERLLALRKIAEEKIGAFSGCTAADLERGAAQLRHRFERRAMWLACDRGDPGAALGAIGLDGPDARLWDDDPDDPEALYIYKMMALPGRETGDALIAFAGAVARATGLGLLRLDCMRENTELHDYWRSKGFTYLRTKIVPDYGAGALFERSAQE